MKNIDKILIPTDFSEEASCAVKHAIGIAHKSKAEIVLLHIVDDKCRQRMKKENLTEESIRQELKNVAMMITDQHHIKADYIMREGTIFTTIGQVANEIESSLILMGTHGVKGLRQKLFGAYSIKVLENCSQPMIIVQTRDIPKEGYNHIVLPIDHDRSFLERMEITAKIASLFESEVHLLKEHETVSPLTEKIENNLLKVTTYLDKFNVKYSISTALNEEAAGFSDQILVYAKQVNANLLIIRNHTVQNPEEYIYGFDEEELINNEEEIAVLCMN